MSSPIGSSGYEPRTLPTERRAFFDVLRKQSETDQRAVETADEVATNATDIATNTTDIATNTTAIIDHLAVSSGSTGATVAANWALQSFQWRRVGSMLSLYIQVERTTSIYTVQSNGNIPNVLIATLDASFRDAAITWRQAMGTSWIGRVASGTYRASTGEIHMTALESGTIAHDGEAIDPGPIDIFVGEDLSLGGIVMVAPT